MKKIGEILTEHCGLTDNALERALDKQAGSGGRLGNIIIKSGDVDEIDILHGLGTYFDMEVYRTLPSDIQTDFTQKVSISFLKTNMMVPVAAGGDHYIAINDPFLFQPLDDLRKILSWQGCRVVLLPSQAILNAINYSYDMTQTTADVVMQDIDEEDPESLFSEIEEVDDLLDDTSDSPVIRLVNLMFSQAVRDNASDIHIEQPTKTCSTCSYLQSEDYGQAEYRSKKVTSGWPD